MKSKKSKSKLLETDHERMLREEQSDLKKKRLQLDQKTISKRKLAKEKEYNTSGNEP